MKVKKLFWTPQAIRAPLLLLILFGLGQTFQSEAFSGRSPSNRSKKSSYKESTEYTNYKKTSSNKSSTSKTTITYTSSSSKTSSSSSTTTSTSYSSKKLHVGDIFQYQLDGSIRNHSVDVVFLDLFDNSSSTISNLKRQGKRVMCYFSAGTAENWRPDYSRIPSSAKGRNVDGWSGERWMDIRNSYVVNLSKSRIDLARSKGCDGIDPDNVDVYDNSSGFSISRDNVKSYLYNLSSYAHSRGLIMGLKNSAEIASSMSSNLDFAVVEECFEWNECGSFSSFISKGKPVFIVEYRGYSSSLCSNAKSRKMSLIFTNEDLKGNIQYCR